MESRIIHKIITAEKEEAAPGFYIQRPLPAKGLRMIDPFLLLDHMGPIALNQDDLPPGVPPHPHRGFQPVTFVFNGKIEHKDSLGNHFILQPGDVQWLTAGRGLVHSEYVVPPEQDDEIFEGIQLWVNLPASQKMTQPRYQMLTHKEIPVYQNSALTARIITGLWQGLTGPVKTYTPMIILDIYIRGDEKISVPVPSSFNAFIYVVSGRGVSSGADIFPHQLIYYFRSGDQIDVHAINDTHIMLFAGEPINEPVASYGPFVMNNMTEIQQAIMDYEEGLMGNLLT